MDLICKRIDEFEFPAVVYAVIPNCPDANYFVPKVPEVVIKSWSALIKQGVGKTYAAYVDGKPVGMLAGLIAPDMLGGVMQALEVLWQVVPAHRNTGAGAGLLELFEEDARALQCKRLLFGAMDEPNGSAMVRLYRRKGYKRLAVTVEKLL